MRVCVTGGSGTVGGRLVRRLLTQGHQVSVFGRSAVTVDGVEARQVDLQQRAAVGSALDALQPDAIVNCAAMTDVDGCERDPVGAWATNAEAVATLADWSRRHQRHLVHVSTDYVFDGDAGPYEIDAVPNARGVYAQSKLGGELAVRALAKDWTIARTAVVYGWPAVAGKNNFGAWLVGSLTAGKPVKLFSDQWVSPSHADNVADMLFEIVERRVTGVLHTSGGEVVDRVTFGHRLCERFGFDRALVVPSRMADVNLPSPRPARSGLVTVRTAAILKTQPWSLAASLERLHAEVKGTS